MSKGHWYCGNCDSEIHPSGVTFDELHSQCGCQVKWIDESDKHYGFYQLCPKCEGWGEVRLPETSTPMFGTCPVCNGAKLLVRPEIKNDNV